MDRAGAEIVMTLMDFLMVLALKVTLVTAMGAATLHLARRRSAAERDIAWRAVFLILLILPLVALVLPPVGILPAPAATPGALPSPPTEAAASRAAPAGPVTPTRVQVVRPEPARPLSALGLALSAVWLMGVTVALVRLGRELVRVRHLARSAEVVHAAQVRLAIAQARQASGVTRPVRTIVTDMVSVPAHWGVWRPIIALPPSFRSWSAEEVDAAVRHEMAHVARFDALFNLLTETVRALYWVHPLVRWAARRASVDRERSCDDATILSGVAPHAYARQLLSLAQRLDHPRPAGALCLVQRSALRERIAAILDARVNRAGVPRRSAWAVVALALVIGAPMGAVQLRGQASQPSVHDLVASLRGPDRATARLAAWALGEREDARAVSALSALATTGDADLRIVAAWALGEIKHADAIPALTANLDHDDPLVREMAILALGELESPDAVPHIVNGFARDSTLRAAAVWALGEIDAPTARTARRDVHGPHGRLSSFQPSVWSGRLNAGTHQTTTVEEAAAALHAADPATRRSAAARLGRLDDQRAIDPLLDVLRDPDPSVRAMVVWALDEINPSRSRP